MGTGERRVACGVVALLCTVVNKAVLSFISWEDLVVGAPQYFKKEEEIGGAVYVYVNNQGMWDKVKPMRIDGPQDSMFGLAVANLGDINQDGYHGNAAMFVLLSAAPVGGLILFLSWLIDFAVGAPNDNKGAGKVFIYHGSKTGLQSKKAGQVCSKKPQTKCPSLCATGTVEVFLKTIRQLFRRLLQF